MLFRTAFSHFAKKKGQENGRRNKVEHDTEKGTSNSMEKDTREYGQI